MGSLGHAEPIPTALILAAVGGLLAVSVLLSGVARRTGLPLTLLFLALGMAAGSEGPGGVVFDDAGLAFRLGTGALALILFDGGLSTPFASVRAGVRPAAVLATFGVAATAGLTALAGRAFGLAWGVALLIGAVVSSTDAAAVFSALRAAGLQLKKRVGMTLELESGLNDPVAVLLTLALTERLAGGHTPVPALLTEALLEIGVGAGIGAALGFGAAALLRRVQLPAGGLYPVFTLSTALLAFGVPTLLHGSGFLGVYVCGLVLGNRSVRYRSGLLRVHDAAAWLAQVVMFLTLGLLVSPRELVAQAALGVGIGLFLAVVARPLAVAACLLPFGFSRKEIVYVGAVGLRGAVPIILATFPILRHAPGAERIFNVVFFVVVVNAVVPGAMVARITRQLGLLSSAPPPPPASLEIASTQLLTGEVVTFVIAAASAACGATLSDLPFPDTAATMVVVRGTELLAPRGNVTLLAGDHLYVVCKREDLGLLELMFGAVEDD